MHHRRYVRKSGPVAPIYLTTFHVVYRNSVDKYPEVVGVEPTHHDTRVSESTAGTSYVHRGSGLEKLWEFCVKCLRLDLLEGDIAHGYGHLTILWYDRGNHFYLTKAYGIGRQHDFPEVDALSTGTYFIQNDLIVTDATNRNLGTMRYVYTELSIEVGGHPSEGRSLSRSY